jgi:small basic protein
MPLRVIALTIAGLLLGLGLGLAIDLPAPGLIAGLGVGMVLAALSTLASRTAH